MTITHTPLLIPIDAVIFDCDGTLSRIEGIDQLAKNKGVGSRVQSMTAKAMGATGLTPLLYQARLDLVAPSLKEVIALGKEYFKHQVADAKTVIQLLTQFKKTIYLISAGVNPAVNIFGSSLSIPKENIFAVTLYFNESNEFIGFDKESPLIHNHGKREIVSALQAKHAHLLYVGDGLNDLAVYDLVTRFVGFGGVFYRKNIAKKCEFYTRSPSLLSILPFALTTQEYEVVYNLNKSRS